MISLKAASDLVKEFSRVTGLLDEETPEIIKSTLHRIQTKPITDELLNSSHNLIKEEIKKLKNPNRKEMLRYLTLIPIQLALQKINPVDVDSQKKLQFLIDLKNLRRDKELQQKYTEKTMEEGLSKGAPS